MSWENLKILLISPEAWGRFWVSKHHYANELARRGANVWFLNPPEKHWSLRKLPNNISIITYKHIKGINKYPKQVRDFLNRKIIDKIYQFGGINHPDIVWHFDPFRFQNMKLFGAKKTIYHQVDRHHAILEKIVIESSDLALTVSPYFSNAENDPKSKLNAIGHSLPDHFMLDDHSFSRNTQIKIGYLGNLQSQWIDKELVMKLVKSFTDVSFYFAGPCNYSNIQGNVGTTQSLEFLSFPNVKVINLETNELPAFLSSMDILLLFYKKTGDNYPVNSHKILEYLSSGKIVLSMPIRDYFDKGDLMVIANSHEEYLAKLSEAIANIDECNSEVKQKERIEFANRFNYDRQLELIYEMLYGQN
jgi:hypothetical protein